MEPFENSYQHLLAELERIDLLIRARVAHLRRLPGIESGGPDSETAAPATPARMPAADIAKASSTMGSTPTTVPVHRGVQ